MAGDYDDDIDYDDDDLDFSDDEELEKPEPMTFPDAFAAWFRKPVALDVPRHRDAFEALERAGESRFPAKRVASSASALAAALRATRVA